MLHAFVEAATGSNVDHELPAELPAVFSLVKSMNLSHDMTCHVSVSNLQLSLPVFDLVLAKNIATPRTISLAMPQSDCNHFVSSLKTLLP